MGKGTVPGVVRVAALLRVSTTKVEQEESPEAQLAYIQEEIRRRRQSGSEVWVDTGLVYQDELTGALVMERPDVKRALADAQAGQYDLLAMKTISRMGRDTLGLLSFKRHLDDLDVELMALQDGYRSSRDLELIFLVHADRAQHGRLEISRNVSTNMRQKARQGKWVVGTVPFGYRRKNRHQLELHPQTAPLAKLIFDLRLQGLGSTSIARHLNSLDVPAPSWWYFQDILPRWQQLAATDERWAARLETKRRQFAHAPAWSTRGVLVILRNTAYRGELVYNRVYFRHRLGGRVTRETRPQDDWIKIPCPALVTPEEWERAQDIDRRQITHKRPRSPYLLTRLLTCGRCGGRMSGGGALAKGTFYRYYQCHNRREHRACDAPRVRADQLEAAVVAHLQACLAALPEDLPDERVSSRTAAAAADVVQQRRARLDDLADERRYYRNEHRKRRVSDAELASEMERIGQREATVRAELDRARASALAPHPSLGSAEQRRWLRQQVARLQAGELNHDEKRALLILALDHIVCAPDNSLDVSWKLPLPAGPMSVF